MQQIPWEINYLNILKTPKTRNLGLKSLNIQPKYLPRNLKIL